TTVVQILKPDYTPRPASALDGTSKAWARILKRAGITQRTTIHDVRRTYCTQLIERGVPLPIVSAIMGHRTMATTQKHYAHASDKAVAAATLNSMAALLADVEKAKGA